MFTLRYNGQFIGNAYRTYSGRIWLDNVACTGNETDVMQCRHTGWGIHNCHHSQDVSVSCFFDPATQYAGQNLLSFCRCHCYFINFSGLEIYSFINLTLVLDFPISRKVEISLKIAYKLQDLFM